MCPSRRSPDHSRSRSRSPYRSQPRPRSRSDADSVSTTQPPLASIGEGLPKVVPSDTHSTATSQRSLGLRQASHGVAGQRGSSTSPSSVLRTVSQAPEPKRVSPSEATRPNTQASTLAPITTTPTAPSRSPSTHTRHKTTMLCFFVSLAFLLCLSWLVGRLLKVDVYRYPRLINLLSNLSNFL